MSRSVSGPPCPTRAVARLDRAGGIESIGTWRPPLGAPTGPPASARTPDNQLDRDHADAPADGVRQGLDIAPITGQDRITATQCASDNTGVYGVG
jgi:hypothetical protein